MSNLPQKKSFLHPGFISVYAIALFLIMPNLVWIALDKGVWHGDPVGYALQCINLCNKFESNTYLWLAYMFSGYKAPFMFWAGQFLVAIGDWLGAVNFMLLLLPLAATYCTIMFTYKSNLLLFKSKTIALCGSLVVAGSPLLNGLSREFWIDPVQTAIVSWFIYAMIQASRWSFYSALSQLVIAASLAMLIKVSSPVYIIGPALAFCYVVLTQKRSLKVAKADLLLLVAALLFFIPTVLFYAHNFGNLLAFARFASTSPLFGSDASKLDLWVSNIRNGVFLELSFILALGLFVCAFLKAVFKRMQGDFNLVFMVALFQVIFFFASWLTSSNVDPRYFVPAVPYFALLICWGLHVIGKPSIAIAVAGLFFIQFTYVTAYAYNLVRLTPPYGSIRPLIKEPDHDMQVLQSLIPLARHDSALVFDLNPELGVAEFQYELAKQKLNGNWYESCIDVTTFFNFYRQEIDTAKIDGEMVWKNVQRYNPRYYVTWRNRLSSPETEIPRIDKYNAATVRLRWQIARKMDTCALYEVVSLPSYPELLIYKRRDIPMDILAEVQLKH